MDENNQYGMAMTRPLPYGCIKRKKHILNFDELEQLLQNVSLEDKIGHFFTVNTEFTDVNPKTLLFNEIYPPIFEKKKKKVPPYRCSCSQILSRAEKIKNDELKRLPFNSKTHAVLGKHIFVSLYAEDLHFLITRAGWKVTKIYDHYTFKQDFFKRDFVIINQNARKIARSKVEKDFYKLLNNSNFGNDCRNNIGNSKIDLLYDGLEEVSYIKQFTNILRDQTLSEFLVLIYLKSIFRLNLMKKLRI